MFNVVDIEAQVSLMNVDLYGVQFKGMLMKAEATPEYQKLTGSTERPAIFMGRGVTPGWEDVQLTGSYRSNPKQMTKVKISKGDKSVDMPDKFKDDHELCDWLNNMMKTLGV